MALIWDIWQTTWDRKKLFTPLAPSAPIKFVAPGPIGSADIVVNDSAVYQPIAGFGASLILRYMFTATDGANAAGLNYIRVPLGASDFSASLYSLDDASNEPSFRKFSIDGIPPYVFSVLRDIQSTNNTINIHVVPWSPPGWMKDSGTMNGGSLKEQYIEAYPTYLMKAVQGFQAKGFPVYAISIQNEPQHSNTTYPTCAMTPDVEGRIGRLLRALLNSVGLASVKLIGYEHNWDNAGTYPVELMNSYSDAFDGVAFHCYIGSVKNQESFYKAHPSKTSTMFPSIPAIYFTECTGTNGSDWWSDIKWYMDNLWIGSLEHHSQSGLMWNIATDASGNPKLPGTTSCGGNGCRAMVTVNSDGTYSFNQEFYAMAQASKAVIPKDPGGPYGQRIGVSVGGSMSWALRVSAFVTERKSSKDWLRYSIVVLNWNDSSTTKWNPKPVTATIEFQGTQATYTFPVGVTTLWWFAPSKTQ
ncbi:glycoside hydrolase family 30 protein [Hypholoma sublateritium FD-334 SS-4]|uniref:Glycoside hydrolase family 30 protein n=1 Tax=Hypholoma sublateritium (strain FD-334 SS-4) TaxID=945553 RepID=A0A0D2LHE2_HYPSF|nr:glycoside hydrolase family 30 protein [Hypholoma sublateritium FD-334 SS-4]